MRAIHASPPGGRPVRFGTCRPCTLIRCGGSAGSRGLRAVCRRLRLAPRLVRQPGPNAMLLSEMHGLLPLECVAVALLILANGFFVAAEFALVSVRETRIEQMLADHVPGARAVRVLQRQLDDFLPAVQLGVTLCSLALG